ncbi:DUF4064 domain-containing protein [Staphylococcus equorum]|uniref:DUF4064 domain-containing protein n=1 Tax=Staphylococcus equorum TaxID=246432 RepID=UPI00085314E5|nr:DUF4064 domain-containing protein [Staphylococcus equorum]MCZ4236685.1 DUF4064 domain-containing protein [Staphylococcus equorum]MEB7674877.1 DUF4064 domain-containing protein [Staphylococcus equorum]MEB7745728.1 DUF4064 domain-containing protein [Staphylococcus equorum]OEK76962.1 hypothetical protein AST05_06600 [Staphylococcus equorum]RIL29306.1 DUF4064 domain-containing protein [Staphylococcus equorum]
MIKRTTERVLTWIGIALQLIGVVLIAVFIPMIGNNEVKETVIQQMMADDPSFSYEDGTNIFGMLSSLLTAGLVLSIVILIIAIIGAILINKKAKAAGILLILVGVISFLGNWINAILWIVAGVMLLVRKLKQPIHGEGEMYNDNKQDAVNESYERSNSNQDQDLKDFDDLDGKTKQDHNDPYKY